MANAKTRSFSVKGALGAQGGADECGIPEGATAASINLTAISQSGTTGFVRGWAYGSPPATSTLLNFSPALNASNSLEVPLCAGACVKDITLKTFGSAHVVGEVLGYFVPQIRAEITPSGSLSLASPRVISSSRLGGGVYRVKFDRSVADCNVVASIGADELGWVTAYVTTDGILAYTYDSNGQLADLFWDFQVSC